MAYTPYPYVGYPPYYPNPVPDQLAQLRQQQMQQSMMQGQMTVPPQTQPSDTGGIIWVQGEAGAKAYHVAPGNTVQLWDSEDQVIYLKSADMSGVPSMKVLDYTARDMARPQSQQAPQVDMSNFVTWDELWGKLDTYLAERLKRPSKAAQKKEDAENG